MTHSFTNSLYQSTLTENQQVLLVGNTFSSEEINYESRRLPKFGFRYEDGEEEGIREAAQRREHGILGWYRETSTFQVGAKGCIFKAFSNFKFLSSIVD